MATLEPGFGQPVGAPASARFQLPNIAFALLLIVTCGAFLYWGHDYIGGTGSTLFITATAFGVFMAFNIGGNDVANSFGTSVGAGTLSIGQALAVAAVFEVSGAVIAGGEVTDTIRSGIVDLGTLQVSAMQFVRIMMSALAAAALWLLFASRKGWPVSTTHSIVGGIVGSSVVLGTSLGGTETALALIQWDEITKIVLSWVVSPLLGGVVSYGLFRLIKHHVLFYNERAEERVREIRKEQKALRHEHRSSFDRMTEIQQIAYNNMLVRDMETLRDEHFTPDELETDYYRKWYRIEQKRDSVETHHALQLWVPLVAALGSGIISSMLLFKGLKNMELGLSTLTNYLIMAMIAALAWVATFIFVRTLRNAPLERSTFLLFSWMQVFTACGFAFSHGANDIANAVGPFAAILDILRTGEISSSAAVPPMVMITFGVALIVGLWFIGKEVIATVGHGLTAMHPASGFCAELSAAAVVMLASTMGIPVSSTHILIGAVLGIGIVNRQTNWGLMKPIAMAWVVTLPAAGLMAAAGFVLLGYFI